MGSGLRQRSSSRAAWTAVDQALSSASNFGVAFVAARLLDPREFGAFGVGFAVYLIALGVSRSVATDPLVLRFSATYDPKAERAALGTALGVGLGAALAVATAATAVAGPLGQALLAFATVLPALLLQDAVRFAAFARGEPRWAAASDGAWVLTEAAALWAVRSAPMDARLGLVVLAWGGSAAMGVVMPLLVWRVRPSLASAARWLRTNAVLARRFAGEFAVTVGAGQLAVFSVAPLAGVAQAGALRAGQVLLGPLNVLFMACTQYAVPEGVRLRRRDPRALRPAAFVLGALLVGAAVLVGAAWAVAPEGLGRAVLGPAWKLGRSVVVPMSLAMAGSGAATVAYAGLRVVEATDRSLRVRAAVAPAIVTAGTIGAAVGGVRGAVSLMAAAQAAAAVLAWRAFLAAWRRDLVAAGAPQARAAAVAPVTSR
jgi:hypothetical protein